MLEFFEQAVEKVEKAKRGEVDPGIELIDMKTEKPLNLNRQIRIGRGMYGLVAGPPGTGKTGLVDTMFMINPFLSSILHEDKRGPDKTIYHSLERPPMYKVMKAVGHMILIKHGIILDIPTMLQWSNKRRDLTDDDVALIKGFKGYMIEMSKKIQIIGGPATPSSIKERTMAELLKNGSWIRNDGNKIYSNDKEVGDFLNMETGEDGKMFKRLRGSLGREIRVYPFDKPVFMSKDPQWFLVQIVDHMGKVLGDGRNDDAKKILDDLSGNNAVFRDADAGCFIDIVQLRKDEESSIKSRSMMVTMGMLKGSGNMGENADWIISIIDPAYHGVSRWEYQGGEYHVDQLLKRFRILQIVKNSYGVNVHLCPGIFVGETGHFEELPHPSEMTSTYYDHINLKFNKELLKKEFFQEEIAFL